VDTYPPPSLKSQAKGKGKEVNGKVSIHKIFYGLRVDPCLMYIHRIDHRVDPQWPVHTFAVYFVLANESLSIVRRRYNQGTQAPDDFRLRSKN
jgi:hypothetical protein